MIEKNQTAGIILAAGMSKRFKMPKQLLKLNDKLLIEWVLDASINSDLAAIYLVLGHESEKILNSLDNKYFNNRITIVINKNYKNGMSTSLLAGLSKAMNLFPSVMFLLGDQPMMDSQTIDWLLEKFHTSEKAICVPVYKHQRGNPVIFSKSFYPLLFDIKGDMGARQIILNHPEHVLTVEINNSTCFIDIDVQADLKKLSTP